MKVRCCCKKWMESCLEEGRRRRFSKDFFSFYFLSFSSRHRPLCLIGVGLGPDNLISSVDQVADGAAWRRRGDEIGTEDSRRIRSVNKRVTSMFFLSAASVCLSEYFCL